jgi:hypothetical protein
MRTAPRHVAILTPLAILLVACSGSSSPSATGLASVEPSRGVSPPASATNGPATPPASEPAGTEGVVVTFRVADVEEYRVLLTDPDDIAIAEQLLAGEEAPRIPNGVILRDGDGGVNTGYSWHIDPDSIGFAEVTIEVCDGLPSYVEDGSLTGDRFCPWAAQVIDIQPAG